MVNVSKQLLEEAVYKKIFDQFAVQTGRSTKQNAAKFLQSLLTDTEQVMLSKRLSAIVMLDNGYSPYKIATRLKMSPTTASLMFEQYQQGSYGGILGVMGKSKADREKMWQIIELILRAGMPPRGKGRWDFLKEHSS